MWASEERDREEREFVCRESRDRGEESRRRENEEFQGESYSSCMHHLFTHTQTQALASREIATVASCVITKNSPSETEWFIAFLSTTALPLSCLPLVLDHHSPPSSPPVLPRQHKLSHSSTTHVDVEHVLAKKLHRTG
jgi:hypothetical protein